MQQDSGIVNWLFNVNDIDSGYESTQYLNGGFRMEGALLILLIFLLVTSGKREKQPDEHYEVKIYDKKKKKDE